MVVEVSSLDKRLKRYAKPLRETAEGFFKFYGPVDAGRVDIFLVNASQARKLNRGYRSKDKVTDVIAVEAPPFPGPRGERSLGEVYLNPSSLKEKPYDIRYALIHGLLHLLGFTHQKKSDKMEMEKVEQEALIWLERRS